MIGSNPLLIGGRHHVKEMPFDPWLSLVILVARGTWPGCPILAWHHSFPASAWQHLNVSSSLKSMAIFYLWLCEVLFYNRGCYISNLFSSGNHREKAGSDAALTKRSRRSRFLCSSLKLWNQLRITCKKWNVMKTMLTNILTGHRAKWSSKHHRLMSTRYSFNGQYA